MMMWVSWIENECYGIDVIGKINVMDILKEEEPLVKKPFFGEVYIWECCDSWVFIGSTYYFESHVSFYKKLDLIPSFTILYPTSFLIYASLNDLCDHVINIHSVSSQPIGSCKKTNNFFFPSLIDITFSLFSFFRSCRKLELIYFTISFVHYLLCYEIHADVFDKQAKGYDELFLGGNPSFLTLFFSF